MLVVYSYDSFKRKNIFFFPKCSKGNKEKGSSKSLYFYKKGRRRKELKQINLLLLYRLKKKIAMYELSETQKEKRKSIIHN